MKTSLALFMFNLNRFNDCGSFLVGFITLQLIEQQRRRHSDVDEFKKVIFNLFVFSVGRLCS